MTNPHNGIEAIRASGLQRASLWLMTAAMVLIIGMKSHGGPLPGIWPQLDWHWFGWPVMAAGLWLGMTGWI